VAGIPDPFVGFGPAAKAKFLILGSLDFRSEALMNRVRSLNLEHVSPFHLKGPEISHRPASAGAEEENTLARMRRWFFARTEMSHLDWIGDACARASVTRDIHKVEDLPNAARHLTGLSFSDALGRCCHGGDQGRRRSNGVLWNLYSIIINGL
jgi:hypothetical protein